MESLYFIRVTNSTMHFMVEKVRAKLQGWDARKRSAIVQATLAQSVLLSFPNYFMQYMLIPKKVCDEVEGLARSFIWGNYKGKKKMSLVGWDVFF